MVASTSRFSKPTPLRLLGLLLALVMFHRLDGHAVWVNTNNVNAVQGAGQIGFQNGTLISAGCDHVTVTENVSEVVRAIRAVEEKK